MSRYLKKTSLPVTFAVLLAAALFAFRGEAQQPKVSISSNANSGGVKPISGTAVAFAESDAVRDLPDPSDADILASVRPREMNPENVIPLKMATAQQAAMPSIDATLKKYTSPLAPTIAPSAPSAPIANFDGISDLEAAGLTGFLVAPSDENLAVGPTRVVQTVNNGFKIWDKSGNVKTPTKLISKLFAKLGGVCATFDQGDPVVMHDRMSDRWIISQFDFADPNNPPYYECIAVSKTSDPAGTYYTYAFQTPGNEFPDYPKLGTWPDGYYMTVNQFTNHGPFNGVGMYAFDRSKMLVGDPTASFIYFNENLAAHPEGFNSTQPSDLDGFTLPAAGQPNVFIYAISDELESPPFNIDALRMFNFHADFVTPANSTFIERAESPLPIAAYDARSPEEITGSRAEVKQPAPAATPAGTPPAAQGDSLNAIPYRVMYRLQYRRLGNNENLTGSFTVNTSGITPTTANEYQAGSRFFELRKTSAAGAYSVFDQATFSPDSGNPATGLNRFLPSAAIDNSGDLAMSYSTSSTSVFPSIAYVGRDGNAAGPLGAEQTLFAGTGVQLGSGNRWGDYQSLQVDPSDDCTFWTTNQYYNTPAGSTFNWLTRIGSFKFPACLAPTQETVTGTITSCETGAPISGALVQFSNGFSVATNPDGTYSINLPLGSYSVTVSDPGRKCTPSAPGTVSLIVSGDTVQFDKCLSGIANPIVDTSDPTTVVVSGGNGDGQLNPNECNRLNVRLLNSGCATAKVLSATLTSSSPGVTIVAPAKAPYPDLIIDASGFNSVPFQVFTDSTIPPCSTVNFTLTTTFNGGSTTNNFTVPTACGTAPNQSVSGSIDPTDPKTTNGRLGRADPPSSCAVPKACPGALPGGPAARSYDVYTFTQGPGPSCVTFTPTTGNGSSVILAGAYLGAFDPTNVCTRYLATQGAALGAFSFTVPANAVFSIAIMEASAGSPSTPYAFTISGISATATPGSGPCATTLTTQSTPSSVALGGSISDLATLATGGSPTGSITFKLFGPNNSTCSGTPIFTSVQPVNGDGTYSSQSFTPSATGTYNWIASYSGDANNPAVSGACGDPNESTTVGAAPTPTATPTATATATATATPTATPASQTLNLSTRMRTDTGNNVGIGGFTITGSAPKHVLIRALGPSLTQFGFTTAEVLADPTLEVHGPGSFGIITNNNWRDSQEAQITADGLAPTNDLESAIDATLPPGAYTALVKGNNNGAGICTFEVYDLDTVAASKLANLSSRAFVGTGNNVVIAGFVLGNNQGIDRVVIRGLGPSLSAFGISNVLADPTLELRDQNGTLIMVDNDWQDNAAQAAEITADGLAPSDSKESAIAATLPPGAYTAILAGLNDGTGVGTVEVYDLGQ
jgi:hypothetical protein